MALHPDVPSSPHAILDPAVRWFPADESLRETTRERESVSTVDDVDSAMAFRFRLHRLESGKAEATVSKDVKIASTKRQSVTPTGLEYTAKNIAKAGVTSQSDAKSDARADEIRLVRAFRELAPAQKKRLVELAESGVAPGHD